MANYSPTEQLRYVVDWFQLWSDYQREDFIKTLAKKISSTETEMNGITEDLKAMSTTGRPPSIFACQLKLFNDWWKSWTETERSKLTDELKQIDPKFSNELETEINGTRTGEFEDYFVIDPPVVESTIVVAGIENENHKTTEWNQLIKNGISEDGTPNVDERNKDCVNSGAME